MKSAGKRRTKIYHTVADGPYHTATHAFSGRPKVNGEQVKCTKNQFRTQATLFLMGLVLGGFLNDLVVFRNFVCRVCGLEVGGVPIMQKGRFARTPLC